MFFHGRSFAPRVLYVGRSEHEFRSIARILQRWPEIRLSHASDASRAVELWASMPPHVVLIDLKPGDNDYPLLRASQAQLRPSITRTVTLRSLDDAASPMAPDPMPSDDVWFKPLDPEVIALDLVDALARINGL